MSCSPPVHALARRITKLVRGRAVWYFAGETAGRGILFVFLIAVSRLVTVRDYAYINLFVTLANIAAIIVGLGLPNAVVRYFFSDLSFPAVLGTQAALIVIAGAATAVGVGLTLPYVSAFLALPPMLVALAVGAGIAIAFRQGWLASLRAMGRSRVYALSQVSEPSLTVLVVGLAALAGMQLAYGFVVLAYTLSVGLVAATAVIVWRVQVGMSFRRTVAIELLGFSWPLILHALANYALNTIDQVIINQLSGPTAAGIYAFAYRFGMAMVILSSAFSAIWMPTFLDRIRTRGGEESLHAMAGRAVLIFVAAEGALSILLPPIAGVLGGSEYRAAIAFIPIILYGYLWFVLYTIAVGYALHEKRTGRIAVATGFAGVLNVSLNYILVPAVGIGGAAVATVLSYMGLFGVQAWNAHSLGSRMPFVRFGTYAMIVGILPIAGYLWWR